MTQTATKTREVHVPEADALSLATAALNVSNQALAATTGLDTKLDTIISMLGCEREDGRGGWESTGLLGRVRRVETVSLGLVKNYQGWFKIASGFGMAFVSIGALVTWLVSNHIIKIG